MSMPGVDCYILILNARDELVWLAKKRSPEGSNTGV
jgi:hypothetical protein